MSLLVLFDSRGAAGGGRRKKLEIDKFEKFEKWKFEAGTNILETKTINIVYDKEINVVADIKSINKDDNYNNKIIIKLNEIKKRNLPC